jgi:hypothetical protein
MAYQDRHPEQDPAEGSQETIDRELARLGMLDKPVGKKGFEAARPEPVKVPADPEHRPM